MEADGIEVYIVEYDVGEGHIKRRGVPDPLDVNAILALAPATTIRFVVHTYLVKIDQEAQSESGSRKLGDPIRSSETVYLSKCSPATVWNLLSSGRFPDAYRLCRHEVDAYLVPGGAIYVHEKDTSILLPRVA